MDEIDRMDMPGFLKMRAWNARQEQKKKEPRQRYIDEVWSSLKPFCDVIIADQAVKERLSGHAWRK